MDPALPGSAAPADLHQLEKYRSLKGEAHRVLRCLDTFLDHTRYQPVDTGRIAQFLGIKSQAVSRALRVLMDQGIIERGDKAGRSNKFRLAATASAASDDLKLARLERGDEAQAQAVMDFMRRNLGPLYDEAKLRRHVRIGNVELAWQRSSLIACALIDYNRAIDTGPTIRHMVVDEASRRRGIGARFSRLIEQAYATGKIFVEVDSANKDLLVWLLRRDFDIAGQMTGPDGGSLTLILRKSA